MTPRWPQDGPKTAQDDPKMAQDGPKMAQENPKMVFGKCLKSEGANGRPKLATVRALAFLAFSKHHSRSPKMVIMGYLGAILDWLWAHLGVISGNLGPSWSQFGAFIEELFVPKVVFPLRRNAHFRICGL